jgi:hypothetical protein
MGCDAETASAFQRERTVVVELTAAVNETFFEFNLVVRRFP